MVTSLSEGVPPAHCWCYLRISRTGPTVITAGGNARPQLAVTTGFWPVPMPSAACFRSPGQERHPCGELTPARTLWFVPGLAGCSPRKFLCAVAFRISGACSGRRWRLFGADYRESLVDEDVVWPVDADVVDLVLAVAQLHHTVDDGPRVGRQGSFGRLIRGRSADDRARSLAVIRRDLAGLLGRGRCTFLEGDNLRRRASRRPAARRLDDDLRGRDGRAISRPEDQDVFAGGDGTGRGRAGLLLVGRGGRLFDGHLLAR